MKNKLKKALFSLLGHAEANATNESLFQVYPGYEDQDLSVIQKFSTHIAARESDYYMDGFGVKTLYQCVPFITSEALNLQRLELPVPDDGFHAEAIEYVAVTDALNRFQGNDSFCAVEIGAGWAPWIGLAGVIARQQGVAQITLVGVEASAQRFPLMRRHLETNDLRSANISEDDAQNGSVFTRLFNGAIWTHDGVTWFPESDVNDMGAAATTTDKTIDYRGSTLNHSSIPCKTLSTLLQGIGMVDFMHIDIQGAEAELLQDQIDWLSTNVRTLMVATHSRSIEGKLIDLLFDKGWQLHREKPCRVDWYKDCSQVGKNLVDGSQYWLNVRLLAP
jgi:FkbM family methyltransferase